MITIMCSVYNSEKYLPNYFNMVNNQLLSEFHIIFVDANSSDNSFLMLEKQKFRNGIAKHIITNKKRNKIYEAWNQAVNLANTEYVINVNCDDQLYPAGLLTYFGHSLLNPEADVIYGNCVVVADQNHTQISTIYFWPTFSFERLKVQPIVGPFPLYKRKSLIEVGYFSDKFTIVGDWEMWLRLAKNGYKFHRIKDIVGSYFFNPDGVSTKDIPENRRQMALVQEMYK